MEIILSKNCASLTGAINKRYGYYIKSQTDKNGVVKFFSARKSKGFVPTYGHLNFIFACAILAKEKLYVDDIRITAGEIDDALEEFSHGKLSLHWSPRDEIVNAKQVLQLKKELGL